MVHPDDNAAQEVFDRTFPELASPRHANTASMNEYQIAQDGRSLLLPDGTILSRGPDYMTPQRYEWATGRGWFLAARQSDDGIECLFEDADGEAFIVPVGDLLGATLLPSS